MKTESKNFLLPSSQPNPSFSCRLCQLTSLQLNMNGNLFLEPLREFRPATEDGFPFLLDLRVVGCMDLANLTCLLNPFQKLQALNLHIDCVGASKPNAACLLRPCRSSLR